MIESRVWKVRPALASAAALAAVIALGSAPGLRHCGIREPAAVHATSGFHVSALADAPHRFTKRS